MIRIYGPCVVQAVPGRKSRWRWNILFIESLRDDSFRVTTGVFLLPVPRRGNNLFQRRVGRFPPQHVFQLFLAGDQDSGVAWPARRKLTRDFSAGDTLSSFDDF